MLVERRIAGIIRWLERLKQSYSSGAMESALMDAECARADLEDLRQAVWSQVKPSGQSRYEIFTRILAGLRTLSLAVIIVLMAVVPLSRELPAPVVELDKNDVVLAEPIIIIREDEHITEAAASSRTASAQPAKKAAPAPQKRKTSQKRQQAKSDTNTKPAGTVPYDKVYSLIQTGQRALKNNTSVIKIQ